MSEKLPETNESIEKHTDLQNDQFDRAVIKYPKLLEECTEELFYWDKFTPGVKPNTIRIHLKREDYQLGGAADIMIDTETYERVDETAVLDTLPSPRYVKLIDLHVDPDKASL